MTKPKRTREFLPPGPSYGALQDVERSTQPTPERPAELPLERIKVAPRVFQWRLSNENIVNDEMHTADLVRALDDRKQPLDPILVAPFGEDFYVVDGHHRLIAYRTVQWRKDVPVEHFEGDLKAAQEEALRRNNKNKLPMTKNDRFEAAWRMMKMGDRAHRSIQELTTVSLRTLSTMAAVLRERKEEVAELPWSRAKRKQATQDQPPDYDWVEEKAQKLAAQLQKNTGGIIIAPDVLARALEIISADLPVALIQEWRELVRDALDRDEALGDIQF